MTAVVILTAFALVACDGGDRGYLQIETWQMLPEDVTQDTIKNYMFVKYFQNGKEKMLLSSYDYTIVSFSKTENEVYVKVKYKDLEADARLGVENNSGDRFIIVNMEETNNQGTMGSRFHVRFGERISKPQHGNVEDAEFLGWFTADGQEYDFNTVVDESFGAPGSEFTLYGKWKRLVTINFIDNNNVYETKTFNVLDKDVQITVPEVAPEKENYKFKYWLTEENYEWHNEWVLSLHSGTYNVHPKYEAIFKVVFNMNGGDAIETMIVENNERFTLPQTATKDGCEFLCWSWDDWYFSETRRTVFPEEFYLEENTEEGGNGPNGVEAGYELNVYAEWYDKDEVTEGLVFRDTDSGNCVVTTSDESSNHTNDTAFSIVIPSVHEGKTVVGIDDCVFQYNYNLQKVFIPETVTAIGKSAFMNCENLRAVDMSARIIDINNMAFQNCRKLDLVLPEGLKYIGDFAFSGTSFSGDLPSTLKSIGNYAFGGQDIVSGCKVTNVVLPEGLIKLGQGAFMNCRSLTSVTLISSFGQEADIFSNCRNLSEVIIPEGVERLPEGMFEYCYALKNIELPSTIKYIGDWAFRHTYLESISLPSGLMSIGKWAFSGTYITEVTIPVGITEISDGAFNNCSKLTKVVLPANLTVIGDSAFYNDRVLSNVNFPTGLQSIGENAFANTIISSVELPSVITIGNGAFSYNKSLKTVTLSDKITSIGSSAFFNTGITSLHLTGSADGLTINKSAFASNASLTSVTLSGNITSIGTSAFKNCGKLQTVSVENGTIGEIKDAVFESSALETFNFNGDIIDWLKVKLTDGFIADLGATFKLNGEEPSGDLVIEPKEQGSLIKINAYSLSGLTKITSVTLRKVQSIAEKAFYGCTELTKAVLEDISDLTSIERNVFDGLDKLQYNTFGNGLYLGNETDKYLIFVKPTDTSIAELTLHSDTEIVANSALRYEEYADLATVTIPNGVRIIGDGAFYGCNGITELVIPNSVTKIGQSAIVSDGLQRLTVPFVGETFDTNTKLNWCVTAPSLKYVKVTGGIVDKQAFSGFSGLEEIDAGEASFLCIGALAGCDNLVKITVPDSIAHGDRTGEGYSYSTVTGFYGMGYEGYAPESLKELVIAGGTELHDIITHNTYITKITIPKSITAKVQGAEFNGCPCRELYYEGTSTEWEQIAGERIMNYIDVVHCSDKDVVYKTN